MTDLIDNFNKLLADRVDKPFLFSEGQLVRIKKGVINDGQTPLYYAGATVEIISCHRTSLYRNNYYIVYFAEKNATCEFTEDEIDQRGKKRDDSCRIG